jgi:phosphohistidine swiveling domain-containing protein
LTGLAVDPHDTANDGRLVGGPSIAVIEGLDNDSYDLAFRYDGVVIERLVSRLGHFSILCRELGVPIVSGVPEATLRLVGRPIAIEGATNSVEILARLPAVTLSPWARTSAGPRAVITTTELIVTLLAGSPEVGVDPADAALAIARAYGRSLGARAIEIVASPLSSSDLTALDRLARRYGAAFSAAGLQTRLPRMAVCDHLTLHK